MVMEILRLIHRSRRKKSRFIIEAWSDSRRFGLIRYFVPKEEKRPIILEEFTVRRNCQRRGIGSLLIHEFVKKVGPGRDVTTDITNTESLSILETLEPERKPDETLSILLTEPVILKTLPIVRVSESGSLNVVSVRVNYNPRVVIGKHHNSIREATAYAITNNAFI